MRTYWQDLRYALRLLKRSPAFTVVAVGTLALGIGANTAMFAVVNAVLVKPLPFEHVDRLMLVHLLVPDDDRPAAWRELVWSYPKYRTFLEAQRVFDESALYAEREISLTHVDEPERLRGEVVTDRYPAVVGVAPLMGRPFTADEAHRPGSTPVVLISEGVWRRRFAADPSIVGRTLHLNASPYTVVGVLPRGFRGLSGQADVWVPLAIYEPRNMDQGMSHAYFHVARRKADVSEAAAVSEMQRIGLDINRPYFRPQARDAGWTAGAVSLSDSRADGDVRRTTLMLLATVGFVLLIACVNLTALLAAKAGMRRSEVAIRLAVGASRARIARQFTVEALVLAGSGAAAGLLVAQLLLSGASALLPDSEVFFQRGLAGTAIDAGTAGLTRIGAGMIGLDGATLAFSVAIALLCAMLVAFLPGLQASSSRPIDALKAGGGRVFSRLPMRTPLLVSQIALALVLLSGAGLMLKSLWRLQSTDAGVNPEGVLTVRLQLPSAYTREQVAVFFTELAGRVRQVPGVDDVGLSTCVPASVGCGGTVLAFGSRQVTGADHSVGAYPVSPEYFSTLGIQLRRGRNFTVDDRTGRPRAILVNETAARTIWPGSDPIGQIVSIGLNGWVGAEVVGIVSDVRYRAIETAPQPDVYVPFLQEPRARMQLFVRSRLDTRSLVAAIGREVGALDANVPLADITTMEERFGDAIWRPRASAWLLTAFAALAVLLTATGIFGVMMQTVTQRAKEFAVRIALGAQARDVLAPLLRHAAMVTAAGLVLGTAVGLALTRLVASLLYDVPANDPATFMLVTGILGAVTLVASYIPARRATRVDAMATLKAE